MILEYVAECFIVGYQGFPSSTRMSDIETAADVCNIELRLIIPIYEEKSNPEYLGGGISAHLPNAP